SLSRLGRGTEVLEGLLGGRKLKVARSWITQGFENSSETHTDLGRLIGNVSLLEVESGRWDARHGCCCLLEMRHARRELLVAQRSQGGVGLSHGPHSLNHASRVAVSTLIDAAKALVAEPGRSEGPHRGLDGGEAHGDPL